VHELSPISYQQKPSASISRHSERSFFKPVIQPKLSINQPNDVYEQEADAMADKVMRMPDSLVNDSLFFKPATLSVQRKCAHCEKEEKVQQMPLISFIQKKEAGNNNVAGDTISSQIQSTKGLGSPLSGTTKDFMESRFGTNFSNVNIHTCSYASQLSNQLNAKAFTIGNDIYFNEGKYQPESSDGKHLLAHELTHTVQQNRITNTIQRTCSPAGCKCGPDATNWFVNQVNRAMSDPAVLSIRRDLRLANTMLTFSSVSTDEIAEAGATSAIEAQEMYLGSSAPVRNATINSQLSAGRAARTRVLSAAGTGGFTISPLAASVPAASLLVASAAFQWRALVNHLARYDFKAHPDSMNHPHSATCPDDGCTPMEVGVITLCPGVALENCYESDLPGNLFYALIGRYVGWSELTLQLGSQLAELTDTRSTPAHQVVTWDSPQDTSAISLGYHLPLPLTAAALCRALPAARSTLSIKAGCIDCFEPTPSVIR